MKSYRTRWNLRSWGRFLGAGIFALAVSTWLGPRTFAAEPTGAKPDATATDLLADSTLLYAEIAAPGRVVERVLQHPLAERVKVHEAVQRVFESPQITQARLGVGFVELGLNMTWQSLVENVAAEGVRLVIDGTTRKPVVLVRGKDAATMQQVRDRMVKLVRDDARNKGRPDPYETGEHRGITGYKIHGHAFLAFGPWLAVSESSEALKQLVDAWLDGQKAPLGADPIFVAAYAGRPANAAAWAFARLDKLRDAGAAAPLVKGATDNPAAELLFGGIMTNLQKTGYVTGALTIEDDGVRLIVSAPHDRQGTPAPRKFFFGPDGRGTAPAPLNVPHRLAVVRAFRDIGGMWAAAPDLFDERVNGELAQANTNLSNVLGGKDFGQDVLESLGPELQVVAARAKFDRGAPEPAIKLPAFGIVARLRDVETSRRLWKVMFQTIIGFINIGGGMQGLPLLELETETVEGNQFVTGRYIPPDPQAIAKGVVGINYNFSPTLAVVDDRLIVASNRLFAQDLAKAVRTAGGAAVVPAATPSEPIVNTEVVVDAAVLREILSDNRRQLVAQNMLKEGHDRESAEAVIGTILGLSELFHSAGLRLESDGQQLRFQVDVRLAPPPAKR